jgi:hypothetical protein
MSDFQKYLTQTMGVGAPYSQKIMDYLRRTMPFTGGTIEDLFLSHVINRDGTPQFINLSFFTDQIVAHVSNFVQPTFSVNIYRCRDIRFATIQVDEISPTGSRDVRRIMANFFAHNNVPWFTMQAVDDANCEHLMMLYKKYMLPHLISKTG